MVIRRVGPLSFAKITGILYGLMGLLLGAIFSLMSLVSSAFSTKEAGAMGMIFGVAAVVVLPIFYGVLGFVSSLIAAALYNLIASWVGGIEMDVQ
jgi:hypothetical protein